MVFQARSLGGGRGQWVALKCRSGGSVTPALPGAATSRYNFYMKLTCCPLQMLRPRQGGPAHPALAGGA